jgi:ADP-ribosylglycohydrolase
MLENNSRNALKELLSEFIEAPIQKTYANEISPNIENIEKTLDKIINKQINQTDKLDETLKKILHSNDNQTETLGDSIKEIINQLKRENNVLSEKFISSTAEIDIRIKDVIIKQNNLLQLIEKHIDADTTRQFEIKDVLLESIDKNSDFSRQQQLTLNSNITNEIAKMETKVNNKIWIFSIVSAVLSSILTVTLIKVFLN